MKALVKSLLRKLIPTPVMRQLGKLRDQKRLQGVETLSCDTSSLLPKKQFDLSSVLTSAEIAAHWQEDAPRIDQFAIPDGTGGVNPGDRRAIYYLIRHLQPRKVLEVGTHIGASTVHIALAMQRQQGEGAQGERAELISVDLADVNDPQQQPWRQHGTELSPRQMIGQLGVGEQVRFIAERSLDFMAGCEQGNSREGDSDEKFDFIFLDGSHSADVVYQEVPVALRLLNSEGVILLHDYYPQLRPLWSNGAMIAGPRLAIDRLCQEGASLVVLPLGELPWPTKLGSRMTSLALLLKG